MKTLIIFSLLLFTQFTLAQDTIRVKPEIKEVTIFTSIIDDDWDPDYEGAGGSQLEMECLARLKKGKNYLVFTNLPNFKSYQVEAEKPVEIISKGEKEKEKKEDLNIKEIAALESKKEVIEKEISHTESNISIYTSEREMILSNKTLTANNQIGVVDEIKKLADFYRQRIGEIDEKLFESKLKLKYQKEELAKLEKEISSLKFFSGITPNELGILVYSPLEKSIKFKISIYEPTASWSAIYDLKVNNIKSPFELHYKAQIKQTTGIDWKNVKVNLSSSQPQLDPRAPEIDKWSLDYHSVFINQVIMVENVEDPEGPIIEKTIEGEYPIIEQETSFIYTLPGLVNIPSRENAMEVEVVTYKIPSVYEYVCVPKYDTDVFLTASIVDWSKYNLLDGKADIYFEGKFSGSSYIFDGWNEDTLKFSLGRDKSIVVERKRATEYSKKTFLSGKKTENVAWDINIRNNKSYDVEVTVKDHFPVSTRKEIEVKDKEASNGAEIEKSTGIIKWKVPLQPSENKKLWLKYSVSYPKDKHILIK
jgi:uncharacterized protein (TIGR02231 family)